MSGKHLSRKLLYLLIIIVKTSIYKSIVVDGQSSHTVIELTKSQMFTEHNTNKTNIFKGGH
jgi:hypothetical protein